MKVKVNTTGTHEHKGKLKVRLDVYPDIGDKTYAIHYVDKPTRPYTEKELADEKLRELVPTAKELNPCLCHFITVDPDITKAELNALIAETFDGVTISSLDDALSGDDSKAASRIMARKTGSGRPVEAGTYQEKSTERDELNARLVDVNEGLEVAR